MREINDQYPEYAEPYEPVKGGKHHKGLYGAHGPKRKRNPAWLLIFMFLIWLFVVLTVSHPGEEDPGVEPQTSTEETSVTSETKSEEPDKPEEPDQPEKPETTEEPINPEEHKEIPETPTPPEEPKPQKEPDTPYTPETESEEETEPEKDPDEEKEKEPEKTPVTPEEQTYKDPTVSIAHVYYWFCLDHIEVEYVITANDGENITSSSTVTSNKDSGMTVTMPTKQGEGTIDANVNSKDQMVLLSADTWTTEVTLDYTLDGEAKTLTVSNTAKPELRGYLWMNAVYLSGNSSTTNKIVSDTIEFNYPKDDRHTYDVSISKIEMGWMKAVSLGDNSTRYEKVGTTVKTVWDGTGSSPVTGPSGPTVSGSNKILRFSYADVIDVTPPEDAKDATHFYLVYHLKGTGTDTDGTVYAINSPTYGQSRPCKMAEEPTVKINYVYDWDCLHHVEVGYTIEPGSAEILSSTGTVSLAGDPSKMVKLPVSTKEGTISANVDATGKLGYQSADLWNTEITVQYILAGQTKTLTASHSGQPDFPAFLWLDAPRPEVSGKANNLSFTANLDLVYDSDERHTYDPADISVTKIEQGWMKRASSGVFEPVGSTRTVWPGTGNVAGPVVNTDHKYMRFTYEGTLDATPPADADGATAIYFIYEIAGTGKDSTDGTVYTIAWPVRRQTSEVEFITYDDPEVSIFQVNLWDHLNHIEVEYEITANDAENIKSTAVVTSDSDPTKTITMPTQTGAGTIDTNADGTGKLWWHTSGDTWTTEVTLEYTVHGEKREMTVSKSMEPSFQGYLWYRDQDTSGSGSSADSQSVSTTLVLLLNAADRHTYDIAVTGIDIGWQKRILYDGDYVYQKVGSTKTVWDGSGTCPVTGPVGPTVSGDSIELAYTYSGTLDAAPPANAAGATHYYLIFHLEGTGTDTDAVVYTVQRPQSAETSPLELPGSSPVTYTEPEVTLGNLYWYSTVDHVVVQYDVTANDATDITSQVTITQDMIGMNYTVPETGTGAGSHQVQGNAGGAVTIFSSGDWTTTIKLSYKLGGEDKEKSFAFVGNPTVMYCDLDATPGYIGDKVSDLELGYEMSLIYNASDIHTYSLDFTRVELEWVDAADIPCGSKTIWNKGDAQAFWGPYGPYGPDSDNKMSYLYSFWIQHVDATPPDSAATGFRLHFYGYVDGDDTYDTVSEVYTVTDTQALPSP